MLEDEVVEAIVESLLITSYHSLRSFNEV